MRAGEIAAKLAQNAESVAALLMPQGKRVGPEWEVGGIGGEAGHSLKIRLSGPKTGVWSDFATGASGDLLDLWAQARGLSVSEAMEQARDYLGVRPMALHGREPKRVQLKAPRDARPADSAVMRWLTEVRKLPEEAVRRYRLAERKGELVLPAFDPEGGLQFVKYRSIAEKRFHSETGGVACLFGWQAIPPAARTVVICEGECFPPDAQVLTRNGWVSLGEYRTGEVAQYSNGEIQWVHPLAKIEKQFCGDLIRYETRGYVSVTTPNHNLVSIDYKGREYKHTAQNGSNSTADLIPRTGILNGSGIRLSDEQIQLGIAVSADAAIDVRKQSYAGGPARRIAAEDRYARFGFKKRRKIERLREIIASCGLHASDSAIGCGYQSICMPLPEWVPGRMLPWSWIADATIEQREIMLTELVHWDGNSVPNRNQSEYVSKYLQNAEWVQALAHSVGRVSSIIRCKNEHGSWFKVSILHGKKTTSWQTLKNKATYVPYDGLVYCVQVPSGALVVRQEEKITITGNCDAVAWSTVIPALSVTNGASSLDWIEYEFDRLARFDTIYLSYDMDEAGQRHIEQIVDRLGRERCRVVSLPRKDANECLMAGDDLGACLEQAQSLDPPELRRVDDYRAETLAILAGGALKVGVELPWEHAQGFAFGPSEFTVVMGETGHGKSEITNFISLIAMRSGLRTCVASLEFHPARWLRNVVRQAGTVSQPTEKYANGIMDWLSDRCWLYGKRGTVRADHLIEVFSYAARRYGCRWFVVDNLAKCGIAEDNYPAQKELADKLGDFANAHRAHVVLVAHTRKDAGSGVWAIKGSGGIADMADNVWRITRNRKQEERREREAEFGVPESKEEPDAWFRAEKVRDGETEPRIALWWHAESHQHIPTPTSSPIRFVDWAREGKSEAV